jgi:hypothetical protein
MGKILLKRLNIMRLRGGVPAVHCAALQRSRCACAFGPRYSLKTSTFLGVFAFVRILDFCRMSTSRLRFERSGRLSFGHGRRRRNFLCIAEYHAIYFSWQNPSREWRLRTREQERMKRTIGLAATYDASLKAPAKFFV